MFKINNMFCKNLMLVSDDYFLVIASDLKQNFNLIIWK